MPISKRGVVTRERVKKLRDDHAILIAHRLILDGPSDFSDCLDTIEALWKVADSASYCFRHGYIDKGAVLFTELGKNLAALSEGGKTDE